jgi:hypothetical protein
MARKEKPAACLYCDKPLPKPRPLPLELESRSLDGGHCECGALFLVDVTGKLGGQALIEGLTHLCGGDSDRALALQADVDYDIQKVGYRPRTHSIEPRMPPRGGYGMPKLWFFKLLARGSG